MPICGQFEQPFGLSSLLCAEPITCLTFRSLAPFLEAIFDQSDCRRRVKFELQNFHFAGQRHYGGGAGAVAKDEVDVFEHVGQFFGV